MILAIDLGTTATKVSLVSAGMSVFVSSQERVTTYSAPGGVSEQESGDWLLAILTCIRQLHQLEPQLARKVEAIAVTGHMLGCLPVDAAGRPLHRHLLHGDTQSRRQVSQIDELLGPTTIYQMSGNRTGPSMLGKILWFKQEHPEIYARTATFLHAKDYVTGWLTGQFRTTDFSDASHACMINVHTLGYQEDIYQALGLDMARLPELHRGTDLVGTLSQATAAELGLTAGVPVAAGAGDGACSAIGAGAAAAGDHYCCLGTTAWTACMASHPVLDRQMRNFNIVSGDGYSIGSFGTIQNAGRAIEWAQGVWQISDLQTFDRIADTAEAGSRGLIFLPYLEGERTPLFDPDARGVLFGLSHEHQTAHCLRAVIEGISLALRDTVEMHRDNGLPMNDLKLIGGGGRSDFWRRILASILNIPVSRLDSPSQHATTVGAAVLAGTAIGLFKNLREGTAQISRLDTEWPDPAVTGRYDQLHAIYQALYPALKPSYDQLADYRKSAGC